MKKILIDCRMYGMSGIGRYIENLIEQLIDEEKTSELLKINLF